MKSYFIWNDENSLDNGIIVNELPAITRAEERVEKIHVSGRSGYLIETDGSYEGTVKPCECTLDEGNIDYINIWLRGYGKVVFSNEPEKVYTAYIINQIPFNKVIPTLHKFVVVFDCQPFKEIVDQETITITQPTTLYNQGTKESEPKLKIYGTGNVSITINNQTFYINNLVDYIIVDSEMMDCYRDSQSFNNLMIGDFPTFKVEEGNSISYSGNIEKIEINPRWCFL
jgi:phage-related protein